MKVLQQRIKDFLGGGLLALLLVAGPGFLPTPLAPAVQAADRIVVREAAATITGEFVGPWPAEGRRAFERAARLLARHLDAPVTITVVAEWAPLDEGILGRGGPAGQYANFDGAAQSDTYYPAALANQLAGDRLEPGPDIETGFNSAETWYFGDDARPPAGQSHFASTVIHEILHGMGFLGTFYVDAEGLGTWGDDDGELSPIWRAVRPAPHRHVHRHPARLLSQEGPYPDIYDRFVVNGRRQRLLDASRFPRGTEDLADELQSEDLYWDGAAGIAANGGPVKLFAPEVWVDGSSFSHLDDDTYDGTANAIMTAGGERLPGAEPGPVILGMLADMGWRISRLPPG